MAEQNDKYFTTSNHPSLHYTQQTSPYIKKNNKKSSSIVNQRGSVRDSVVLQNDKNYSRRTHFKSDYSGLTRPVNDGSRLYHSYLWDENKQKQHVERVINIKPRVDHAAPDVNSFHLFSMQKMRDMNRRKQKLDDENRIIVDRVSKIMSDGRSDLDCWNPEPYKPDDSYYKREATKKRERENSFILERLVSVSVIQHYFHDYPSLYHL